MARWGPHPDPLPPEEAYWLGYTLGPHGLQGELKAHFEADQPTRYRTLPTVWVAPQPGQPLTPLPLAQVVVQPSGQARLLPAGFTTREQAEALARHQLYLPLAWLPPLRGRAFYYHEVVGYTLQDETSGRTTTIRTVRELPAHPLLEVEVDGQEALVPLVDDWLLRVDRQNRCLVFRLPQGLFDVYLDPDYDAN